LTAREKERARGRGYLPDVMPTEHAASQADGLRMLLSMTVTRAENDLEELAVREQRAATDPDIPVQEPGVAVLFPAEPASRGEASRMRRAGRPATSGRHAAAPPPYLDRRGARFVLFSAIGGVVFLMGLGLQVVLTGRWHVLPLVSYLVQAVASVETSFLLNRWLTWRDRNTRFWLAFTRFNAQKTVSIALNLALYAGLLRLGVNYLLANVVLTAAFTVVNYVAGDRLVFIPGGTRPAEPAAPAVPAQLRRHPKPSVSVVIPCRDNERTIGAAVQSLLHQDYPRLREITLIGSPEDPTWTGLAGITDPRVSTWELEAPPGVRDANFKRDVAVRMTSGDLVALVDSDIVLPPDWLSRAVAALDDSGASCVAGGMRSVHDSFWGRYTDSTWIGAKTPRVAQPYTVTSTNFGAGGRKPPILANALFTRELYERCPIDPSWSHGSYEDYEWFWRVTKTGYGIRVCHDLFGWHHHRRGLRALTKEYRRSSRGCAYFIRAHPASPLARRRLRQAIGLPLAAITGAIGATVAAADGHSTAVAGLILGGAAVLTVHQVARSRSLESVAYPAVGLTLGLIFTTGLVTNLLLSRRTAAIPVTPAQNSVSHARQPAVRLWRRLPLVTICTVQAALSLTLVWSNTAYTDEAEYLWAGRLEIAHWLHGTAWPSVTAYRLFSGSPVIYPPVGALADSLGGLAGARLLSLAFMLGATVLLYLTASRLIGRTGAIFAAALWALSEPVMRLAFATFDPLSVFLTTLSAWLIVQAGHRRRRGEFVAAAAVALALANVTAYSGIVIDPMVIAFAFLACRTRMNTQQSLSCAAWLTAAWALSFGVLMTASHSWPGLISTAFAQNNGGHQAASPRLNEIWGYAALIVSLAVIGAVATLQSKNRNHAALLGGLCFAVFMVAQLHDQTPWTIDKHLAYGIWFAAIAAGYACSKFIRRLPDGKRVLTALCCATALIYPAAISWQSAWQRYHAWPSAEKFILSFKHVAAQTPGAIYVPPHEASIAQYYTPQVRDWTRWSGALSLDPAPGKHSQAYYANYYKTKLQSGNYGLIVLFYSTTFSSAELPRGMLLPQRGSSKLPNPDLLSLVGNSSGEPGLPALTRTLEADPEYHHAVEGSYNTSNISGTHAYGIYAIWRLRTQT
jgi:putative flippase GtrA/GT2 family glycosyltransferase